MGKYLKIFFVNENVFKSVLEIVLFEIKSDSYEIEVIYEKMKKIVFDDLFINNKCVIEIRDKIVERFFGFEMVLGFGF